MPKLKAPLFSLKATGRLGKFLTLAKRQGRHIIERRPIPTDAKSPSQLFSRLMFNKCVDLWHLLSDAEQQEWESLARPRHMTGYAWYISQCLRPNPGIYLPLIGGTMTGDIDMGKNRLLKLPLPTDAQEAASKAYVDALAPGLHAATHEDGGADEIDVGALSGLLADDQHIIDAEAVSAMGAKADGNPLHHDKTVRYTDAEVDAILAVHAALVTGVHGAGASTLATIANIVAHGISAKHRYTLNKLRLGAGAGADPTEIDVPTGYAFTPLAGGENNIPVAFGWNDWNIAAIVPAEAVYALIGAGYKNIPTNKGFVGVRANGSALNRKATVAGVDSVSTPVNIIILTTMDVNRVIEVWNTQNRCRYNVFGYWS